MYVYFFGSRHNEAQLLRPSLNSECAPSVGEKGVVRGYPAKSGPIQWLWCVTTICTACWRKFGQISHVASVGCKRSVETKPLARPAQNAGGYSLSIPVAHSPVAVLPMLVPRGMVVVSCHFRSSGTMRDMFRRSRPVGFLLGAPKKPCETSRKSNSGHSQRKVSSGRRQMLAFSRSGGGPGCSRPPTPPSSASVINSSNVKSKSRFPTSSCLTSRRASATRPHKQSLSLRMRGPRRPSPGSACPLACDQVSQGGPAITPTTCRCLTALSQNCLTETLDTSPHTGSTIRSTEMVKMVTSGMSFCAWSMKCCRSPKRRLPEKAWMMNLSLAIGRGTSHRGVRGVSHILSSMHICSISSKEGFERQEWRLSACSMRKGHARSSCNVRRRCLMSNTPM